MRISLLFHFFLYWTSEILDQGDVSANTSSHSDANDQQIDDTGFELISYDTENLVFDDDDIDDEELLSFGIPPNALAVFLIHLLWISMYGPSFTFDWASLGRYVAEKVWGYKKAYSTVTLRIPPLLIDFPEIEGGISLDI